MLKFRPTNEQDRALIAEWIEADPDHKGRCNADFWLSHDKAEQFAVEDEQGTVFFVRSEDLLRLHIQFSPDRKRTAKAIDEFTPMIAEQAGRERYKQLIFESVFKPLIRFLKKRGFHSSPDEYVYDIQ